MALGHIIAFDNSVLSPLIRDGMGVTLNQVDQKRAGKAKSFMQSVQRQNGQARKAEDQVKLAIPALTLAECLCGFDPQNHIAAQQAVKSFALIAEFTELASLFLAKIYGELRKNGYRLPVAHARQIAKHDFAVAASCLASNVAVLIHEDGDYADLATLDCCKPLKMIGLPGQNHKLF